MKTVLLTKIPQRMTQNKEERHEKRDKESDGKAEMSEDEDGKRKPKVKRVSFF